MRGTYTKKTTYLIILISFLLAVPSEVFSQENTKDQQSIITYQEHRNAFLGRQGEVEQQFNQAASALQRDVETLRKKISGRNEELARLNQAIREEQGYIAAVRGVQVGISYFLFPIASSASQGILLFFGNWAGAADMIMIVLVLTSINLFFYLVFRQKQYFEKYRIALIVALVVLITAIALPLFAAEKLSKREQVLNQLEFAEKVLSLSDHERFIAILEAKATRSIELPDIASGDPLLNVFRRVLVETPEYYFTLAALYMHERKTGKAIDAIEEIINKGKLESKPPHNMIAINIIKFLAQQKQTELAAKAVETLAKNIENVSLLLQLAEFLQNHGMQVSEEKVLGYAVGQAISVAELIELSDYLFNKGENDKGYDALKQALRKVRSVGELILVARTAIKIGNDNIIEEATKKTKLIRDFRERIKITDMFLEHGRNEEAIYVFSEMIKEVKASTAKRIDKLLFLINEALKRDFFPQAVKATERLFLYLGPEGIHYTMESGRTLKSAAGLPNPEKITLPQFFGMLNEELGYNDKAEEVYIRNILDSLKRILQSYGYELPEALNDYHLLGRVWVKENQGNMIGHLDRVYTIIENHFLKQQTEKNDSRLETLRKQLREMENKQEKLLAEIRKRESELQVVKRKSTIRSISVTASILLMVAILIGCSVLAFQFAKGLRHQKTFGFITRFLEATGWIRVFSILGVLSGLISIFVAQFLQLIQGIHENTLYVEQPGVSASLTTQLLPETDTVKNETAIISEHQDVSRQNDDQKS